VTTSLPKEEDGHLLHEPLFVDLRWAKSSQRLSLRHPRFRENVLDIAAPLHGRPKEALDSEDVRQGRKFRIAAWSAVSLLALLAVIAGLGWRRATVNGHRAELQRNIATARNLSLQALSLSKSPNPAMHDRAAAFAVEAVRIDPKWEEDQAIRSIVNLLPFTRLNPDKHLTPKRFAFSPDGRFVLSAGNSGPAGAAVDGSVYVWDLATHEIIKRRSDGHRIISAIFSPDGQTIFTGSSEGEVHA
jgi:hypothetical protein